MSLIVFLAVAAMTAPPLPQARLADATCDRLAQGLVEFHEGTLAWEQRAINRGIAPDPRTAELTQRMQAVTLYMADRKLEPRPLTVLDGALYNANGFEMMYEFERRCRV